MIRLIWAELDTPTGQTGPISAAYARAAGGAGKLRHGSVYHAVKLTTPAAQRRGDGAEV